ncbi:MAG: c-type cytochrome [Bryobacteraceae bacterium]
MRSPIVVAAILMLPGLFGQEAPFESDKASPEDVAAGARIYRSHCAECHGLKGEGGRGPNLTSGEFRHGQSDAALYRTVSRGVPGTEMPGIYLQGHQVWQIVAFVRALSAQPVHTDIKGDAEAGRKLFFGKGGCNGCHMVNGSGGRSGPELSEIGGRRTVEHLRISLVKPDAEVPPAFWHYKVTTREGRSLEGRRLNEDTYSLQLLDASGNLHSLLKNDLKEVSVSRKSTMPAYGSTLSASEIDDLVAYLSTLKRKAAAQ